MLRLVVGRPSLGDRKQVNVRLPVDLIEHIDVARGVTSRDRWMENAARLALKPTSVYQEPELRQEVHQHRALVMLRTEFRSGVKVRVYQCDCGIEVVPR